MKGKPVIYAFCQQKGGTGKTTTAHAIGAALTKAGRRVLYIDLDAQRNLTFALGCLNRRGDKSVCEVLQGNAPIMSAAVQCGTNGGKAFYVVPADESLATLRLTKPGWQMALQRALLDGNGGYDAVIIDTPPALGQALVCALTAATKVIIPTTAEFFGLQGVVQILQSIEAAKAVNPALAKKGTVGIVVTKYNARRVLSREIVSNLESIAKRAKVTMFATKVRDCVALAEASMQGLDIYQYAPRCAGASDYTALLEEIQ